MFATMFAVGGMVYAPYYEQGTIKRLAEARDAAHEARTGSKPNNDRIKEIARDVVTARARAHVKVLEAVKEIKDKK